MLHVIQHVSRFKEEGRVGGLQGRVCTAADSINVDTSVNTGTGARVRQSVSSVSA